MNKTHKVEPCTTCHVPAAIDKSVKVFHCAGCAKVICQDCRWALQWPKTHTIDLLPFRESAWCSQCLPVVVFNLWSTLRFEVENKSPIRGPLLPLGADFPMPGEMLTVQQVDAAEREFDEVLERAETQSDQVLLETSPGALTMRCIKCGQVSIVSGDVADAIRESFSESKLCLTGQVPWSCRPCGEEMGVDPKDVGFIAGPS